MSFPSLHQNYAYISSWKGALPAPFFHLCRYYCYLPLQLQQQLISIITKEKLSTFPKLRFLLLLLLLAKQ